MYILPGFIMAMVLAAVGGFWQGVILMVAVCYVTDDTTFYLLLFLALVFLVIGFARREFGLDKGR